MSSTKTQLSRRAVLIAIGATPTALLAFEVSEQDYTAIQSAIAKLKEKYPRLDSPGALKVLGQLWEAFKFGVVLGVEPPDNAVQGEAVAVVAPYVSRNLHRFPGDGRDPRTLSCAAICGYKASKIAETKGSIITPVMFRQAWQETSNEIGPALQRMGAAGLAC